MSDKENDAVSVSNLQVAKRSIENNLVQSGVGEVVAVNNNSNSLTLNRSQTQNICYNISGKGTVHIGNVQYFMPPQVSTTRNLVARRDKSEAKFLKTHSISEMMRSTEPLNEKYLDIFAESFGERYEQVPILLNVNSLDVERMKVDHFNRGGSREVMKK